MLTTNFSLLLAHQGHFFGEFSLLREEPRNANVRAAGHKRVTCMVLKKEVFKPFVESDPKFKQMIAELMLKQERVRQKRSSALAASSARGQKKKKLSPGLHPRQTVKVSQVVRWKVSLRKKGGEGGAAK